MNHQLKNHRRGGKKNKTREEREIGRNLVQCGADDRWKDPKKNEILIGPAVADLVKDGGRDTTTKAGSKMKNAHKGRISLSAENHG